MLFGLMFLNVCKPDAELTVSATSSIISAVCSTCSAETAVPGTPQEVNMMKFSVKEIVGAGLLVSASLSSSAMMMHFGLMSYRFDLIFLIIAALASGFFSGCFVSWIVCRNKSSWYSIWHIPLAGTMTALLPIIFIVCGMNIHDMLPEDSWWNELLGKYHDKISPLHN